MSDEPKPPQCPLHPTDEMIRATTTETHIRYHCRKCSIEIDRPLNPPPKNPDTEL